MRSNQVQTYPCALSFTVMVDWPDCDVDVRFTETGSPFQPDHQVQPGRTPTAASVDRFIDAVVEDCDPEGELGKMGLEYEASCGLMMGCCSVVFSLPTERGAELPLLMQAATRRMQALRRKYVRYYSPGDTIRRGRVGIF